MPSFRHASCAVGRLCTVHRTVLIRVEHRAVPVRRCEGWVMRVIFPI